MEKENSSTTQYKPVTVDVPEDRLAELLRGVLFSTPRIPIAVNVDAALVTDPDQLRKALIRQVTGAVRWVDSVRLLIEQAEALGL